MKNFRKQGSFRSGNNYGGGRMTISGVRDLSKNLGGERGGRRAFIMSCYASNMEQWPFSWRALSVMAVSRANGEGHQHNRGSFIPSATLHYISKF